MDLDSPEQSSAGNINTPRSSDPRAETSNVQVNIPSNRNLSSTLPPTVVSKSRVAGSSEGLAPIQGETESAYLNRQRQTTGNQNLQLSNDAINRAINGREHVWDGRNFVDQNSATLDPRGRNQIPSQSVPVTELPDQPAQQSMIDSAKIGYGPGQIDPALARAANIQGVSVGYGAGQVDPALARAAGLTTGPVPLTGSTGASTGSLTSSPSVGGNNTGFGGGTSGSTPPSGTAAPTSFNDRYDFLTRQKVREGKHGGQGGGAGASQPCGATPGASGGGVNGTGGGSPVGTRGGATGSQGTQNIQTTSAPQTALVNGRVVEVGFGEGQVDPALARAAGGTNIGFGAGQVDPALARAVQQQSSRPSNPKPLPQPRSGTTGPF